MTKTATFHTSTKWFLKVKTGFPYNLHRWLSPNWLQHVSPRLTVSFPVIKASLSETLKTTTAGSLI